MLDEVKVEWLLGQLQRAAERAPGHLRPRRRQIVRGQRSVLNAIVEGLPLDAMRDALMAELGDHYSKAELQEDNARQPLVVFKGASPVDLMVIERWNAGMRVVDIANELGIPTTVIDRVRRWGCAAAMGIQPSAAQRSLAATAERKRLAQVEGGSD